MSTRHTIGAALCTLALAGVAGCGTSIEVSVPGQADGPVLSIGVALDEPGMSWYHNGAYSGFSVQVAQYVAKVLGYANKQIVFRNVPLDERAQRLADGTVDLVVGSYGGQEADGTQIDYAGPYLNTSQGLLVRDHDDGEHEVAGAGDLAGRTACIVQGSDSGQALRAQVGSVSVEERDTYQQCVSSLLAGQSDAVAGPEPILYGLRDQGGSAYLAVLGDSYGSARFGVGMTLADRIVIMSATKNEAGTGTIGRIEQIGTPEELYNAPVNKFVASFIGSPAMNFFNVTLKEGVLSDGDHFSLRLPEGRRKHLEEKGYEGKTFTLGIRPEDIKASQLELDTYPESIMTSEVVVSELLGAESMLYSRVGSTEFVSRVDARDFHKPGEKVRLAFNLNKAHFFDNDTNKAIV